MMRLSPISVFVVLVLALLPQQAGAVPILGLFPTGVGPGPVILAPGQMDPHYAVGPPYPSGFPVSQPNPTFVLTTIPSSYLPNGPNSVWIWENPNGQPTNVTRYFQIRFDLTGFDPSTASITGTWATDNFGDDILLNGVPTGNATTAPGGIGFDHYTPFTINSGFNQGLNTLDFVVRDVGVVGGFRVDSISGTVQLVPEPSSLLIATVTLGLLGYRLRRAGTAAGADSQGTRPAGA